MAGGLPAQRGSASFPSTGPPPLLRMPLLTRLEWTSGAFRLRPKCSSRCWRRAFMPDHAHKTRIACEVNGKPVSVEAYPMARLLDVLREELHLTGTKEGC